MQIDKDSESCHEHNCKEHHYHGCCDHSGHSHEHGLFCHNHEYHITKQNEKRTLLTIIFTAVCMIMEIIYGYITSSMALLSDGYHMLGHLFALGITYVTYIVNRRMKSKNKEFADSNKIQALGGYTSALLLAISAGSIIHEGIERLFHTEVIKFNEAILVSSLGLTVNLVCIFIMDSSIFFRSKSKCNDPKTHINSHSDCNFRAAYYHILADVMTSVFAIAALIIGKAFNLNFLDIITGIFGAILMLKWAKSLFIETLKTLLDIK